MPQTDLARRLSAQDAAFLYGERPEAPLHIGSVAVFEGEVSYSRFVENIESKLHLIPRYLQRVAPAPFNLGHPTWEWDPDFDITRHIKSVTIEPPGTDAQLFTLAGDIFAPMLDRNKPLWEMYLVRELEGNRTGLVSKIHHCLVDGVSGVELMMIVLDVSPEPVPVPRPEQRPVPAIPDPVTRLFGALLDNASERLDKWAAFQKALIDEVAVGDSRVKAITNALEVATPYFAKPMVRAPFNRPLAGGRKLACSEFSFQEIRGIRRACGGTVNDVVLALLGGALARYLEMHGESTDDRLVRVMTPVNVRSEGERGALGNRVSMIIVDVPVGVRDPVERLKAITQRTDELKRRQVAVGIELLLDLAGNLSPALQAAAWALPQPPNTLGNIVCTNVPGPMIPLYSVGHRLLAHYPLVPIAWELGIGCGVTSYDQKLYFGLVADSEAGSDVQRLKEFLDQSFIELRAAAGVARSDLPQVGVPSASDLGARRLATERIAVDAS